MNETDTRLNVITLGFCEDLEDEDEDEEEEDEDVKMQKVNPNETKAQQKNRQLL